MSIDRISKSSFISLPQPSVSLVGKDILGYCSRCKMNLMQTVVTEKAKKADRSRCNTCKTERTYKSVRSDAENTKNGGSTKVAVNDRDEEFDIDSVDVQRVFQGDPAKKKPKAKAKAKKTKDGESTAAKPSSKNISTLPLSMLAATSDDLALFEAKSSSNGNKPGQTYKASLRFEAGDVINHSTFGTGFVLLEVGPTKIEVLFASGKKLLVNAPKA